MFAVKVKRIRFSGPLKFYEESEILFYIDKEEGRGD